MQLFRRCTNALHIVRKNAANANVIMCGACNFVVQTMSGSEKERERAGKTENIVSHVNFVVETHSTNCQCAGRNTIWCMPCELNRNNANAIAIIAQHSDFADEVFGEEPHEHGIVCNEISPPNI